MIKYILGLIIVLALIGGAVQFVATPESWALVVNKQAALSSVQNGVMAIYDFFKALVDNSGQIHAVDLMGEK